MAGRLNGRVKRLEDILEGAAETPDEQLHRERVERMRADTLARVREKAEAEAREGDDRRLRALGDLEEHMRRRAAGREDGF